MNRSESRMTDATRHRPSGMDLRFDVAKLIEKAATKIAVLPARVSAISSVDLDGARRAGLGPQACHMNTSAEPTPI